MNNRNPTQAEQILAALERGLSLTPLDALSQFGCMRLGARVHELRRAGVPIEDEMIDPGNGKHVKRYFLDPAYIEAKRAQDAVVNESQEILAR
jgi:hypothetical protein